MLVGHSDMYIVPDMTNMLFIRTIRLIIPDYRIVVIHFRKYFSDSERLQQQFISRLLSDIWLLHFKIQKKRQPELRYIWTEVNYSLNIWNNLTYLYRLIWHIFPVHILIELNAWTGSINKSVIVQERKVVRECAFILPHYFSNTNHVNTLQTIQNMEYLLS